MKTPRTRRLPPFFTQVIGSLPRPVAVRDLLLSRESRAPAEYRAALDDMVRFAIRLQETAGIDVISDGEWRRKHYVGEFLDRIGGFERVRPFRHAGETKMAPVVVRRIKSTRPVWARDAEFLVAHSSRLTKFAIPSPFLIAIRYWHQDFSKGAYPTLQHFMDHLSRILRREAEALVEAGIDVIQIDDPALTYFCDRRLMDSGDFHDDRLRREWNIETQFKEAIDSINTIVDGLKAEIHLHCCHSVYKRQSDVIGNYKPILPRLKDAKIDRVNVEFAYKGTGVPDDLELLPAHIDLGMGVVDVRGERMQTVEEIKALAAEGARIVGPARMALNPDCGFAPDFGESPTIDEAYLKLKAMCQAAKELRHQLTDTKAGKATIRRR